MGCTQSTKISGGNNIEPRKLFPPERHCTDTSWLLILGILSLISIILVIYFRVTLPDFLEYYNESILVDWFNVSKVFLVSSIVTFLLTVLLASVMQCLTRTAVYMVIILVATTLFFLQIFFWIKSARGYSRHWNFQHAVIALLGLGIWLWKTIVSQERMTLLFDVYEILSQITHDLPMIVVVTMLGFIGFLSSFLLTCYMTGIVGAAIIEDYKSNSGITWRAVLLVLPTGYVFLIGLVWMFLITNFAKCVIGYAIGQLYFARKKKNVIHPFRKGFRCLLYHMGSVVFATILLSPIEPIQPVISLLMKLKKADNSPHCLASATLCLFSCCKNSIDLLSLNALYITALFGLPLCESLKFGQELDSLGVTTQFYMVTKRTLLASIVCLTYLTYLLTAFVEQAWNLNVWEGRFAIMVILMSTPILSVYSAMSRAVYVCACVNIRQDPKKHSATIPKVNRFLEKNKVDIEV